MFCSCVVGTWEVRRGLWLSENDGRFVCSMVTLTAHVGSCVLLGVMVQRHGDLVHAVKTVLVFTVYLDDAVS